MKVSFFVTCLVDVFFPNVGKSVVEILGRYGVEVDFPAGQTCCGQPAYNSGYQREAKETARHMIRVFENSEYVMAPSGSCVSMVRHYYPELLKDDPAGYEAAKRLANKTYEFSEFMVNVLKVTDVGAQLSEPVTAAYHHSCHMSRGLGIKQEPTRLLSAVEGLDLKDLPYHQDCCGFGGTFAVKMGDISEAMADEKIKHLESAGTNLLIGSDMGCLMHLQGRLRRTGKQIEVRHVAEVLAKEVKR